MSVNIADAMLQVLSVAGVKSVYGVSGDAVFPLLDALARQDKLKYYAAAHESGAAFTAAAEARLADGGGCSRSHRREDSGRRPGGG